MTIHYSPESLVGRSVVGCVNLSEKNIAGFVSQFLLVGFTDANGAICLVTSDPRGNRSVSYILLKFIY